MHHLFTPTLSSTPKLQKHVKKTTLILRFVFLCFLSLSSAVSAQEIIQIFAPDVISPNTTNNISVEIDIDNPRDIQVDIVDENYNWYGGTRVNDIQPDTNFLTLEFEAFALPLENTYTIFVKTIPVGGIWQDAIDNQSVPAPVYADEIVSASLRSSILLLDATNIVFVDTTASDDRDILVDVFTADYEYITSSRRSVDGGIQSTGIFVNIPESVPTSDNYIFAIKILPPDAPWFEYTAQLLLMQSLPEII